VQTAGRVDLPWSDRFALLREQVLASMRILVVLDNFEDNLIRESSIDGGWSVGDAGLAGLLAAWLTSPGRSRLLITSRYRFGLPEPAAERLHPYQVPPLSLAETRKLLWSLPRLDRHAADLDAQQRIWQTVGGHPRALEYLDALLPANGGDLAGRGRFADITRRLHHAVETRLGAAGTAAWLAQQRTLDAALADTVTLAADDVLLTEQLTRLGAVEGAVRLLAGISVYREPVDVNGLLFQIGVANPDADPNQQSGGMAEVAAHITDLLSRYALDLSGLAEALGQDSPLTPADRERLAGLLEQARRPPRPPLTAPPGMTEMVQKLATTSLIAIVDDGRVSEHLRAARGAAGVLRPMWWQEQRLRADRAEPGGLEGAHTARVAGGLLRPERLPVGYEMPGGRRQRPSQAPVTASLVDLDRRLPATRHASAQDDHPAVGGPDPHVVPTPTRPARAAVPAVRRLAQRQRGRAGKGARDGQEVDGVGGAPGAVEQRGEEARVHRGRQAVAVESREGTTYPLGVFVGEHHRVRGERDDSGVAVARLRYDGGPAVGRREVPVRRRSQDVGQRAAGDRRLLGSAERARRPARGASAAEVTRCQLPVQVAVVPLPFPVPWKPKLVVWPAASRPL
jgi:hypothetical protein